MKQYTIYLNKLCDATFWRTVEWGCVGGSVKMFRKRLCWAAVITLERISKCSRRKIYAFFLICSKQCAHIKLRSLNEREVCVGKFHKNLHTWSIQNDGNEITFHCFGLFESSCLREWWKKRNGPAQKSAANIFDIKEQRMRSYKREIKKRKRIRLKSKRIREKAKWILPRIKFRNIYWECDEFWQCMALVRSLAKHIVYGACVWELFNGCSFHCLNRIGSRGLLDACSQTLR